MIRIQDVQWSKTKDQVYFIVEVARQQKRNIAINTLKARFLQCSLIRRWSCKDSVYLWFTPSPRHSAPVKKLRVRTSLLTFRPLIRLKIYYLFILLAKKLAIHRVDHRELTNCKIDRRKILMLLSVNTLDKSLDFGFKIIVFRDGTAPVPLLQNRWSFSEHFTLITELFLIQHHSKNTVLYLLFSIIHEIRLNTSWTTMISWQSSDLCILTFKKVLPT